MLSMTANPVLDTRPPLPVRPQPHERDGRQPQQPGSGRPHPQRTAQHDDTAARQLLDSLYREYAPMVIRVAARALRAEDRNLADDIAQDVWLATWQHLLRGNELLRSAGFLATRARRQAVAYYRLARVRREQATDYTEDRAAAHVARVIGAAA
ncbi:sigma factor [Streptomyces sp. NPDC004589]|uniref:RNA polymerase sigma factor n=1 Tax=Streptomyces sp. NPDC004589 TaxID=3154553 RepID=UPI0033ADFE64